MQQPDRIIVEETVSADVVSTSVEVALEISDSTFASGHAALKQAREVRAVVERLANVGIPEDAIRLTGVIAEMSKGLFLEGSSARYTLAFSCRDLDRLADVLVAATKGKHVSLTGTRWHYEVDEATENAWLEKALSEARRKAHLIAASLDAKVTGIHLTRHERLCKEDSEAEIHGGAWARGRARAARTSASDELGMSVLRTRRDGVRVQVEFRVS